MIGKGTREQLMNLECPRRVRIGLLLSLMMLAGCNHGFHPHIEQVSEGQLPARAELILIGVIEGHHRDSFPYFRPDKIPAGDPPEFWRPVRRRIRVEAVLRGAYAEPQIDVYEIAWLGGGSFSWSAFNITRDGERCLFLLRKEGGRWRLVQDFYRSIFPVSSKGPTRMPLDESRPFGERLALMNFWVDRSVTEVREGPGQFFDFAGALGPWRTRKLLRGLLRHPAAKVRLAACKELARESDECWQLLADEPLSDVKFLHREPIQWDAKSVRMARERFGALLEATEQVPKPPMFSWDVDELRNFTTITQPALRTEFCRAFAKKFPTQTDNGCPADQPFAATIVTENGDVPLVGEWPEK